MVSVREFVGRWLAERAKQWVKGPFYVLSVETGKLLASGVTEDVAGRVVSRCQERNKEVGRVRTYEIGLLN